jgi:hypothetical protein
MTSRTRAVVAAAIVIIGVPQALGADIDHLNLERGHRTLRIVRKGGSR